MKNKSEIKLSVRIERHDCDITNYILKNYRDTKIERLKIDEKITTHKLTFDNNTNIYEAIDNIRGISQGIQKSGNNVIWAKTYCCSGCSIIDSIDASILSSRTINGHTVVYNLLLPNYSVLKKLKDTLKASGLKYYIYDIFSNKIHELTDHEEEILLKLYESGYFDSDRKISLTDFAGSINISVPALSDILRRSLKKVISYYLENKI